MQAEPENMDENTAPAPDIANDIAEVETEFASAEEQILALQSELAAAKDRALRALAEAENTRRRAIREKEEASRYGTSELAREMLNVADNFTMALNAVTDDMRQDTNFGPLVAGIEMTARQLQQSLERFGVRQFNPADAQFDPNLHEVFMEQENTGKAPGTITHVIQAGYTLHDRLLRPARVAVAKGEVSSQKIDTKI
jgi:molecular chaperone GrpE